MGKNFRRLCIKTSKTLDELENLTYREYSKLLNGITLKGGAIEFIESLRENEVKIALATSSDWWVVEKIFANLELDGFFDSVTTGEEVINKKPAPDIFWAAADKLGMTNDECLVIEDSKSGVEAAKEAGMKVIAIDETGKNDDLEDANLVVEGFSEITPQALSEL